MIGNITRDPVIRKTSTGMPICSFGIAANHPFKNKQSGVMEKEVCFIDVNIWGSLAEKHGPWIKKGREILVEGHIKLNTWTDNSDNKRSKHLIVANHIVPLHQNPELVVNSNNSSSPDSDHTHSSSLPAIDDIPVANISIDHTNDTGDDLPF